MLDRFEGDLLKNPGKTTLRTKEGPEAVRECIESLNKQEPCRPLHWNTELAQAAKDHVMDIGPKGMVQHESSDGTTVKERLKKYGKVISCYGENLSFHCETALEVVLQLLVDDGVPNRGHRENIFNPEFIVCGGYSGEHKDFDKITTIDYAAAFVKTGEADPIETQMDAFLKEDVEFDDLPADIRGWKQNAKISVQGNKAVKTVTRTCRLKDGSEKILERVIEREFELDPTAQPK